MDVLPYYTDLAYGSVYKPSIDAEKGFITEIGTYFGDEPKIHPLPGSLSENRNFTSIQSKLGKLPEASTIIRVHATSGDNFTSLTKIYVGKLTMHDLRAISLIGS